MIDLTVVVAKPDGDDKKPVKTKISVPPSCEVQVLKKKIGDAIKHRSMNDPVLYFRNKGEQGLTLLDNYGNLDGQGVTSGAALVYHIPSFEKRQSASEGIFPLAWTIDEKAQHRVTSGGEPQKLSEATGDAPADQKKPVRNIANFSWVDDSRYLVKVYVSVEVEPMAVAAANKSSLKAEFKDKSFKITVMGETAMHVLAVGELEHNIIPEKSSVKISTGKRICITMPKAEEDSLWHTLIARK